MAAVVPRNQNGPLNSSRFRVRHRDGAVGAVMDSWPQPLDGPELWICEVAAPTMVLGSSQRDIAENLEVAEGAEVIVRRSGGGAVWMEPGAQVWVEAFIPAGDRLWRDDVSLAFEWLGDAWGRAVESLDPGRAESIAVHRGWLQTTPFSSAVCFAGLGPGEVTIDGVKVVGVSQRRTRDVARFQSIALLEWSPGNYSSLAPPHELSGLAVGLNHSGKDLAEAFVAETSNL